MKILMFNQDWFQTELREMGHEVLTCGYSSHLDVVLEQAYLDVHRTVEKAGFSPDALIFHDNSSPLVITGLEDCAIPSIFYSVDAHHHHALHRYLGHVFDHTFVAQKDYIPCFSEVGAKAEWMPLYASRLPEPADEKKHGAVFVGTLDPNLNPDRVRFFDALRKKVQMVCLTGEWWKIFPESEIVINQTVKGDLNFRVFEAMGSGAMLLTESAPNGLLELFQNGKHIVTYEKNNVDEAAGLIGKYLENKALCREIARAGRDEILAKHLPRHRAARFGEVLQGLKRTESPMRAFAVSRNFSHLARLLERRNDRGMAARALVYALRSAEAGVARHEVMTPDVAMYFVIAATLYDGELKSDAGEQLLRKSAEAYPEFPILWIGIMRMMLNSGRRAEAVQLAKKISPKSEEEVFRGAEEIVSILLAS